MARKTTTILINGDKLRAAVYAKGCDLQTASHKIGAERNYITQAASRGTMSLIAAKAIEGVLGIPPEKYALLDTDQEKSGQEKSGGGYRTLWTPRLRKSGAI